MSNLIRVKPLTEITNLIDEVIARYQVLDLKLVRDQSEILRDLTTLLYDLAKHRIDYHEKAGSVYLNSQAKTNAGKEREAEMKVPELYLCRQIDRKAQAVCDAIRSTISVNKN